MQTLSYDGSVESTEARQHAPKKVLLVEANSTFRAGLSHALEDLRDLAIVDEAETAATALDARATHQPDIAVIDVHLPDHSGIDLCRLFLEQDPRTRVLVLSSFDWDVYLSAAWSAGAAGFLLKGAPTSELVRAIREVATGRIYTSQQLERIQAWDRVVGERLQTLRLREWDVLRQVAAGQSNREISQILTLSENTVEKYLTSLLQKLRVPSRTGLLAFILRYHLGYHLDHTGGLLPTTEIRHSRMADFRGEEMAEFRSDTLGCRS